MQCAGCSVRGAVCGVQCAGCSVRVRNCKELFAGSRLRGHSSLSRGGGACGFTPGRLFYLCTPALKRINLVYIICIMRHAIA